MKGLFSKYRVERLDGESAPGKKHDGCFYFVLDLTHDPHAIPAIAAYANSCVSTNPLLAADLRAIVSELTANPNLCIYTCPPECPVYLDGKHRWTETRTFERGASAACKCGADAMNYDLLRAP
jgi:hypothetical protein